MMKGMVSSSSAFDQSTYCSLSDNVAGAQILPSPPSRDKQAMGIGALPQNAGTTATALAVLADELAFLSGDRSTDLAWYGKRGVIGGIHASTGVTCLHASPLHALVDKKYLT